MSERSALTVHDLWKSFPGAPRPVLRGLELAINGGECFGIHGASGVGKSTLGRILSGRIGADRGKLVLDDQPMELSVSGDPSAVRAIQYLPQQISATFHPLRRIDRALEEIIVCQPDRSQRPALRRMIIQWSEQLGLKDFHLASLPGKLSGGQLQRLAIVRTLLVKPSVLIFDEPTSALDLLSRNQFVAMQRTLSKRTGMTIIIIAHDRSLLNDACDRQAELVDGKLS